jgi:hypothetical protein
MRWTLSVRKTGALQGGRRSRSVLIPRRWYQVGEGAFPHRADDGGNKARSPGRLRRKPLKPIARGMPGETGVTVVTILVCFLLSHARLRALSERPAFPAPSLQSWGQTTMHHSGGVPSRERRIVSFSRSNATKRSRIFSWRITGLLRGAGRRTAHSPDPAARDDGPLFENRLCYAKRLTAPQARRCRYRRCRCGRRTRSA